MSLKSSLFRKLSQSVLTESDNEISDFMYDQFCVQEICAKHGEGC